jgi:hypothetical protein
LFLWHCVALHRSLCLPWLCPLLVSAFSAGVDDSRHSIVAYTDQAHRLSVAYPSTTQRKETEQLRLCVLDCPPPLIKQATPPPSFKGDLAPPPALFLKRWRRTPNDTRRTRPCRWCGRDPVRLIK